MQDLIQTIVYWDHQFGTTQGIGMGQNPGLNRRLYNIGFPGECIALSDAYVIEGLRDNFTGQPWKPYQVFGTLGTSALYDSLETPYRVTIKELMNPLESEFSIWYLIRDLYELPKLMRSLIGGMGRLRSIFGSSPALAAVRDKQTWKAISSLHLANQYGILPTLEDLREFADLVLKWYNMWIKETQKVGDLRTYHGPLQAWKKNRSSFSVPLRFDTFGASHGTGNASVTLGNIMSSLTVKYYFICPELTNLMSALKLVVDQLGIFDPAALWDLVPFSFVIDWFLDVSKLLHSRRPRLFPVTLVIADWAEGLICESHVDVDIDYLGTTDFTVFESNIVGERLFSCKVLQRVRRRQFPHPLQIDTTNMLGHGLTIRRIINGLAIIVGKSVRGGSNKGTRYRKRQRKT